MDDLENYRRRIGTFCQMGMVLKFLKFDTQRVCSVWLFCTVLAVIGVTALGLENDPSIEKNPGPLNTQTFPNLPSSVISLYNKIERLNSKIATHSCHRFFLSRCLELEIIPKGYRVKCNISTASPTQELSDKHNKLLCEYCTKRMTTDLDHHNTKLSETIPGRDFNLSQLLHGSCSQSQYEALAKSLQDKFVKDLNFEQNNKMKKLKQLSYRLPNANSSNSWIPDLKLTQQERDFIINGEQLCDRIIDASMSLLMRENPLLQIQSSALPSHLLTYSQFRTVHVHHNGQGHFVTSSSLQGLPIYIYDSLYNPHSSVKASAELRNQIRALYSGDFSEPTTYIAPMAHRQLGAVDCGLFSIAFAVDLVSGNNPSNIIYDQSQLRDHLLRCLEMRRLSPFPRHRRTTPPRPIEVTEDLDKTSKWIPPKKTSKTNTSPSPTSIKLTNRFSPLINSHTTGNMANFTNATSTPTNSTSTQGPTLLASTVMDSFDTTIINNQPTYVDQPYISAHTEGADISLGLNFSNLSSDTDGNNPKRYNPTIPTRSDVHTTDANSFSEEIISSDEQNHNSTDTSNKSSIAHDSKCNTSYESDSTHSPSNVNNSSRVHVLTDYCNVSYPTVPQDAIYPTETASLPNEVIPMDDHDPTTHTSVHSQNGHKAPKTHPKPYPSPQTHKTRIDQRRTNKQRFAPGKLNTNTTSKSAVRNLSSRKLSSDEISVLELGLSFSPSIKHYNQEQLAEGFFYFIRRMKLCEYFYKDSDTGTQQLEEDPVKDPERSESKWIFKNPSWYPDEVRKHRSEGLTNFIEDTLRDTRRSLENNAEKCQNNLTPGQRQAIKNLAADKTIIIKPSDKCGSVVVMDVVDYDCECLKHLEDKTFYEELSSDPNDTYKTLVETEADIMLQQDLITPQEHAKLLEGDSTPAFYGLPKLHKVFDAFPLLRPICSGSGCCTKHLSELVDTFLKPAANKLTSYLQDTTDFIRRVKNLSFPSQQKNVFLATMDVKSLYTNIDQEEGAQACKEHLDKRTNKSFTSELIKRLILIVLRCNTMIFQNRFFHQIKGTAMGTPMAVNFANLFMGKFEREMLLAYKSQFKLQPAVWLRYIDDVFIIWTGERDQFLHFMNFCNSFAATQGYRSNIQFTFSPPSTSVDFLDTTVSLNNDGTLSTTLFTKPCASHQYLHRSSYHVTHLKNSLPKSQFLRIRRICSSLREYDLHASRFAQYFINRGYNQHIIKKTIAEVRSLEREVLLTYKKKAKETRIPLVLPFHHKFTGISQVLKESYNHMIRNYPQLKKVFPAPPLVSFRRAANLRDKLVKANHHKVPIETLPPTNLRTKAQIDHLMNKNATLHNNKSGRSCKIEGGAANTAGVIYAAECQKHDVICVGHTGQPINARFNLHRSNITCHNMTCELVEHFSSQGCSFKDDLRISILEKVSGTKDYREFKEDKWMSRLRTFYPTGMNKKCKEFGHIYKTLFL